MGLSPEQFYDLEIVSANPEFGIARYEQLRLDDIFDLIEEYQHELEFTVRPSRAND